MLRVLKVGSGDPLLFSKQLRNYEVRTFYSLSLLQHTHSFYSHTHTPVYTHTTHTLSLSKTEGLLRDLHARNTQRTTPKKINKRRFDFTVSKMATETGRPHSICKADSDDRAYEETTIPEDVSTVESELG